MSKELQPQDLQHFYSNRRMFDDLITNILGDDVHLHDLSDDSNHSSNTERSQPNPDSSKSNAHSNKLGEFYSSIDTASKMEKLYKENIDLQKKNMALRDENQTKRQKS